MSAMSDDPTWLDATGQAALVASGVSPEQPVAVVQNATTPEQRVLVSTLARVSEDAAAKDFGSPAIVAIGEMVRLREALLPFAVALADAS